MSAHVVEPRVPKASVMKSTPQQSTSSHARSSRLRATRALRIALVIGVITNVALAIMLLVHTFVYEPVSEIPMHEGLIAMSLLALLMSVTVAVLAWMYLQRTEAARRREEGERLFRMHADTSPLMLWVNNEHDRCIFANKAWRNFTGQTLEQIVGDGWADPIHPDDRDRVFHDYIDRAAKREPVYIEYRVRRHDGMYRWILDTGYPRYNEAGEYEGYSGGCTDVTERREAIDELRQWSSAMEQSMDGVARLSRDGRYEMVSQQYSRFVGRAVEDLIGSPWEITVHPDDLATLHAAFHEMLQSGRVEAEARGVRGDGSVFHKRVAMVARHDDHGELLGHFCFMKDITQEKQREEESLAVTRKLEVLTVSAPVPIYHMLPDGRCTYVNPEWGRVLKMAPEHALGLSWIDIVHPEDRERSQAAWQKAAQTKTTFHEVVRAFRADGTLRWFISRALPVVNSAGELEYIGTLVDFTDVKEAEMSLRESLRAQQLLHMREAALRRELDHRVRNNLAGLLGLLHAYKQRGLPAAQLIHVIEGKILVLKEVHELLASAAGQPIVLADIISRLVTRLAPVGRSSHIRFAGPRVTLAGTQAGAMAMIVQELITNSIKHGALGVDDGHIAVTWTLGGEASAHLYFDWVEMPLVQQPRISAQSRESGIGLSIVEGLARAELRGECTYGPRLDGVDRAWVVSIEAQLEAPDRTPPQWQKELKPSSA
ncbi:MAG: PAS domain S-box protein [Phycisphaerae bacterium]